MNKATIYLIAWACFLSLNYGTVKGQDWEIGAGVSLRDFNGIPTGEYNTGRFFQALHFSLGNTLSPSWGFESSVGLFLSKNTYSRNKIDYSRLIDGELRGIYRFNNGYFLKRDARIAPYITAGVGVSKMNNLFQASFPWGVGAKVAWNEYVMLNASCIYHPSFSEINSYMSFNVSISYRFGASRRDKDKDGLPDYLDCCPGEKGGKYTTGCPDRNRNGIADRFEKTTDLSNTTRSSANPPQTAQKRDDN